MNFIRHIFKAIEYRSSRIAYHLWIAPCAYLQYRSWRKPEVMSLEDTLHHIVKHNSSICRYGDGEFNIAVGKDIGFQHITDDMSKRMRDVLNSESHNILIAIPSIFDDLSVFSDFSKSWWKEYRLRNVAKLKELLKAGKQYPNSLITRFTSDFKEDQADKLIPIYRQIWNGRDIYIIEGEQTRIGVGNDLLSNANRLYRILAPAKNAYDKYDEILLAVKEYVPIGSLVILALGPTATIMAYDLANMGYQALDLGHFDIQYEYHLRGIRTKEPIPGKYVNEASTAGQTVDDSVIKDDGYTKSIIKRIL